MVDCVGAFSPLENYRRSVRLPHVSLHIDAQIRRADRMRCMKETLGFLEEINSGGSLRSVLLLHKDKLPGGWRLS